MKFQVLSYIFILLLYTVAYSSYTPIQPYLATLIFKFIGGADLACVLDSIAINSIDLDYILDLVAINSIGLDYILDLITINGAGLDYILDSIIINSINLTIIACV